MLLLMAANSTALAHDGLKIGIVDLDRIVANSPAGKALQARLERFQQSARSEIEQKTEIAREIRQRLAEGVNTLSDEQLQELQKAYEDAQIDIRRLRDDKQREGQKMQAEVLQEIERALEPIFETVRDTGGYDLILNHAPGIVVMAGPKADITQQIIETMNAGQD